MSSSTHGTQGVDPGAASRSAAVHARGLAERTAVSEHPRRVPHAISKRSGTGVSGRERSRSRPTPPHSSPSKRHARRPATATRQSGGDGLRCRRSTTSPSNTTCDRSTLQLGVDRPKVVSGDPSPTVRLSDEAVASYRAVAAALDPRLEALVALLVCDGLKVTEALALDIDDVSGRPPATTITVRRHGETETNRPRPRQRSRHSAMHRQTSIRSRVRQRTIIEVGRPRSADTIRCRPSHPPTQNRRHHRTGHGECVAAIPHQHPSSRRRTTSTTSAIAPDSPAHAAFDATTQPRPNQRTPKPAPAPTQRRGASTARRKEHMRC